MTEASPLQAEIGRRTADGWEIVSREANEVQMRRPKQFSMLSAFIGSLLFGVGLVVYLAWYWAKRDEYVSLLVEGDELSVTESGGPLAALVSPVSGYFRWAANRRQAWTKGLAVGGPFAAAAASITAVVVVIVVASASGGDSPPSTPVPGVEELCQPLAQAERFRYSFAYSMDSPQPEGDVDEATVVGEPPFALQPASPGFAFAQQLDGAVEHPDKLDVTVRTEGAEGEIRMIFIGDDQWVGLGGELNPAQDQPVPFPPVEMCNAILSGLDTTAVTPTTDTIDGVDTLRYELEDVELGTAVQIWTAESDPGRVVKKYAVTLALSKKDNVPVRMESKGVGTYPGGRKLTVELTLEIKDLNAGDIKVEPPS